MAIESRVKQILLHLLENSIKFTQKGSISLGVKLIEKRNKSNIFEFTVTDSGIGISDGAKELVFAAYTQGDESTTKKYKGTGLGLTIVKRVANAMGGDVKIVESTKEGTTVVMTITLESL